MLCWGSNDYGQTTVAPGVYNQVDVGGEYTCAVLSTGTMACWGGNHYGQGVAQPGTYTQVSGDYTHTCAIRASDLAVVCWGNTSSGMSSPPGISTAHAAPSASFAAATNVPALDTFFLNLYSARVNGYP